jgi:hypothetical protein
MAHLLVWFSQLRLTPIQYLANIEEAQTWRQNIIFPCSLMTRLGDK